MKIIREIKKMKKRTALVIIIAALCLILIPSCKRIPDTGITESTTSTATTSLDPCAGGHTYVDGFCTECGKEFISEGLEYTLSDDGTYYIVSGIGSCKDLRIVIPSRYNHKPVKEIGSFAFGKTAIHEITLPDGITVIKDQAFFRCESLTRINLPDSLEVIEKEAFKDCTSLFGELRIPEKITVIEDGTFSECQNIASVVLPKNLTSIGDEAFKGLYKLREISIPESLTHVGKDAFVGFRLDSVNITNFNAWCNIEFENVHSNPMVNSGRPAIKGAELVINGEAATAYVMGDEVKKINNYTFAGCSSLIKVVFSKNLEHIGNGAFYGCISLQEAILPDSLTYLGESAFSDCTKLSDIKIPQSITEIKSNAFSNCDSISSINIHKGISAIRESAFSGCDRISEILFDGNISEWEAIVKEADWSKNVINCTLKCSDATEIINRASLGLEYYLNAGGTLDVRGIGTCTDTEIYIPEYHEGRIVTNINSSAFGRNNQITKVVLPDSVVSVESYAFTDCKNLKEIIFGKGVVDIASYSFTGCTSLESIVIPDGVRYMYMSTFDSCTSMKSITLPSQLRQLSERTFSGCNSLTDIYYKGTKQQFESIKKYEPWAPGSDNYTIHCTDGDITQNGSDTSSKLYFELDASQTYYVVAGKGRETGSTIVIPSEYNGKPVKSIKEKAFEDDHSITAVFISEGVTKIEDRAFYNSGITEITLPTTLKSIGKFAFSQTKIESVNIKDIYSWCNISFLSMESNPASNGASLYVDGKRVVTVELDDRIQIIGSYQFAGLTDITHVKLGNGIKGIQNYTFSGCTNLKTVELPDGIKNIGNYAFSDCTSLTEFTIPHSLTYLGTNAFKNCSSLTEMIIPLNISSLSGQFESCRNLKIVYISYRFGKLDNAAFKSCTSLNKIIYDGTTARWNQILQTSMALNLSAYKVYCTDGIVNHGTVYQTYPFDRKLSTDGKYYVINGKGSCTDSGIVIDGTYNNLPVTEIADGAFEGEAHSLIYVCDGIASIGKNAFKNCKDTVYVRLPKTIKAIGEGAFEGIPDTARIVFDGTIAEWNAISGSFKGVVCTDGTAE